MAEQPTRSPGNLIDARSPVANPAPAPAADPHWFREPTVREHFIAAGLFIGFGVFFALLFVAERGWGFRWVVLGIACVSTWRGLGHGVRGVVSRAGRARPPGAPGPPTGSGPGRAK